MFFACINDKNMDFENKIPDGWKNLFEPIRSYMKKYNLLHPFSKMNVEAIDVSHGTFDVMISNSNAEIVKLINELKEKSSNTCMICGSSKSVVLFKMELMLLNVMTVF